MVVLLFKVHDKRPSFSEKRVKRPAPTYFEAALDYGDLFQVAMFATWGFSENGGP